MLEYVIQLKCFDCGHNQESFALNPELDEQGKLISYVAGSSHWYCDACGHDDMIPLQYYTRSKDVHHG